MMVDVNKVSHPVSQHILGSRDRFACLSSFYIEVAGVNLTGLLADDFRCGIERFGGLQEFNQIRFSEVSIL